MSQDSAFKCFISVEKSQQNNVRKGSEKFTVIRSLIVNLCIQIQHFVKHMTLGLVEVSLEKHVRGFCLKTPTVINAYLTHFFFFLKKAIFTIINLS